MRVGRIHSQRCEGRCSYQEQIVVARAIWAARAQSAPVKQPEVHQPLERLLFLINFEKYDSIYDIINLAVNYRHLSNEDSEFNSISMHNCQFE